MSKDGELEYKIIQALLVWRKQGGHRSVSVSDITRIAQKIKPGVTESEINNLVKSSPALNLSNDEIFLSRGLTDML